MPASRWHSNINDLFQWIGEDDNELLSMMMSSMFPRTSQNGSASSDPDAPQTSTPTKYPDVLPILPLRGLVVYPQTAVPLTVGQPRSIRLVDEVVAGDRLIGLVAARNPELETPGPDDIYTIGNLAAIHRLFRAADGTIPLL